jgi:hypothetical protein
MASTPRWFAFDAHARWVDAKRSAISSRILSMIPNLRFLQNHRDIDIANP